MGSLKAETLDFAAILYFPPYMTLEYIVLSMPLVRKNITALVPNLLVPPCLHCACV